MTTEKKTCTEFHPIIYEGVGSFDATHKTGVYKIVMPDTQMGNITVDTKIYNISKTGEQVILLWLTMTDGNDVDCTAATEVFFHEVSLDFSAGNIFPYDSSANPPQIDLTATDEIHVVVFHNDTLNFEWQPQKFGLGILRKR